LSNATNSGSDREKAWRDVGKVMWRDVPFVDSKWPLTGVYDSSAALCALREGTEVQPNWCVEVAKREAVADHV